MPLDDNSYIYSFGVRIYLPQEYTQDTDIGLYTSGGTSELRWSQEYLNGSGMTWAHSLILKNGIGDISFGGDLRWGGAVEEVGGLRVVADNTGDYASGAGDPLSKRLRDESINLRGLKCEIWRFTTNNSGLLTDYTQIYSGECGDAVWSETEFIVPIESSRYRRRSNLATIITNATGTELVNATYNFPNASEDLVGETIPVTFGEFNGSADTTEETQWRTGFARYQRISDLEETFATKSGGSFGNGMTATIEPDGKGLFPATTGSFELPFHYTYDVYDFQFAKEASWEQNGVAVTSGVYELPDLSTKYLKVSEGTDDGTYRAVSTARLDIDNSGVTFLKLRINNVFPTIEGLSTSGENQSWASLVSIENSYKSDMWALKSFLNNEQVEIDDVIELYSHTDRQTVTVPGTDTKTVVDKNDSRYLKIPSHTYDTNGSTDKNTVSIAADYFSDDISNAGSVVIGSFSSIERIGTSNLSDDWGISGTYVDDGYYLGPPNPVLPPTSGLSFLEGDPDIEGNLSLESVLTNTDALKSWKTRITTDSYYAVLALSVNIGGYPINVDCDSISLGICLLVDNYLIAGPNEKWQWEIRWRRFIGDSKEIASVSGEGAASSTYHLRSLPPYYYKDTEGVVGYPDYRKNYYGAGYFINSSRTFFGSDGQGTLTGYDSFVFDGITTKDQWESIDEIGIFIYVPVQGGDVTDTGQSTGVNLSCLAPMFKVKTDIKNTIYGPLRGRVYNDTWGGRRNTTAMIDGPVNALEHVNRLQNYSDLDSDIDWGREYAPSAAIDTTATEGGFSATGLTSITGLECARQILDYGEAWTDTLKESLCRDFFMASFVKGIGSNAGKEAVSFLAQEYNESGYTLSGPTITLSNSVQINSVSTLSVEDVFVEPAIQYKYNYATDKYDGLIQLTNTSYSTYDPSFVLGLSGSNAEYAWRLARALWLYYRHVEEPPTDLVQSPWIRTRDVAEQKLLFWLKWMGAIYNGGDTDQQSSFLAEPPRRLGITVPYQVAADVHWTERGYITLAHHTENTQTEYMVERVTHRIGDGLTNLELILFGTSSEVAGYIQDTYGAGIDPDWNDTWTEYASHGEGQDVQDFT